MEEGVYKYTVQPREVDITGHATLITLCDYILHAAGEDADRLGFGVRTLQENNWTWVLSRLSIDIERFPREHEQFYVKTWVNEVSRIMTTRNFVVSDARGEVLARAVSIWAMISIETRHPLDLSSNLLYTALLKDIPCPAEKPCKIAKAEVEEVGRHMVAYSDIDFNEHAGSMKYLQWMIDRLPLEKLTTRHIARMEMNFNHETRYGQDVTIYASYSPDMDILEVRHADGTSACKALLHWK